MDSAIESLSRISDGIGLAAQSLARTSACLEALSVRIDSASAAPSANIVRHRYCILVVEDDALCQELVRRILDSLGHKCSVVSDGYTAIQRMADSVFDLVLMDIGLPELDGLAATVHIRAFNEATPIVAMAERASEKDVERYREGGMTAVLVKPFSGQALERAISRLCDGRSSAGSFGRDGCNGSANLLFAPLGIEPGREYSG